MLIYVYVSVNLESRPSDQFHWEQMFAWQLHTQWVSVYKQIYFHSVGVGDDGGTWLNA